jgi:RNA polymerase sigma-70 factor (ECF subfamily)
MVSPRARLRLVTPPSAGTSPEALDASEPRVEAEARPAHHPAPDASPTPAGAASGQASPSARRPARARSAPATSAPAGASAREASEGAPREGGALDTLADAQLVALACKGEKRAHELLYRRHARFALQLATRIEGSDRDVEDIVHDAFIRAFERLEALENRAAFRSWLGSIVVHAVRSRLRRARLMRVLGLAPASDKVDLDVVASAEASPHVRAQLAQIYALLRTLPTDDRIAWTLRAVEGHDLETVAELTRCSLATVKRRISRSQKFLEQHFVDPAPAGEETSS